MRSTNKSNLLAIAAILCALVATCGSGGVSASGPSNRILGGGKVEPGKYPFMADLMLRDSRGKWQHTCGGTIIDNRHVLTAASCVVIGNQVNKLEDCQVQLGCHKLSRCESLGATYNVSAIIAHHKYQQLPDKILNDIALLKLGSDIKFSAASGLGAVGRVELASASQRCCEGGEKGTAIGWGNTDPSGKQADSLREADVVSIPLAKCKSFWKLDFNEDMICAGNSSHNICSEDAGGPLIMSLPNRGKVQVGIISFFKKPCGSKPFASIKVASFRKWITECVSDKGCKTLKS